MTALIDNNNVKTALGVWCVDGVTLIPLSFNESTNGVLVDEVSTISYTPLPVAPRDANFHPALLFTGSDGLTYPVNVNSNGALLIAI